MIKYYNLALVYAVNAKIELDGTLIIEVLFTPGTSLILSYKDQVLADEAIVALTRFKGTAVVDTFGNLTINN